MPARVAATRLAGMSDGPGLAEATAPGCRSTLFIPILIVLSLILVGATVIFITFNGVLTPPAGPGSPDRPVPPVSDRFFATGSAQARVTGDLAADLDILIDPIASYANNGLVWLSFVDVRNAGAGEILVAFNEPEDSVTVALGSLAAIGRDDACAFDVEVTAGLVAGTISCTDVDVLRDGEEPAGTASIALEFSATTDTANPPED
jgi:hypothetical protein